MKKMLLTLSAVALLAPATAAAKCKDKALGNLKKADAATLVQGLESSDQDCRSDAAKYLGDKIGSGDVSTADAKASFPILQNLMIADDSFAVRKDGLRALEEYLSNANLKSGALDAIQAAFERDDQEDEFFIKALSILMKAEQPRAERGVVVHLSRYRKYQGPFVRKLLDAAQKLNQPEARDLPLLVVMDTSMKKPVRVKALDVLEHHNHPGLADAYVALLDDPDKKIQIRCIDGLSRSGLPPRTVQAALSDVVRRESKGDVRARALRGLKRYTSPELLPLLHSEVLNEKHVMAWYHAMEMLLQLADETSFDTLNRILVRQWAYRDDMVVETFHTLLRLVTSAPPERFGPMADQVIASIGAKIRLPEDEVGSVEESTRIEGQRIIDLLTPMEPAAVIQVVETYAVPTYSEVVVVDLDVVDESAYSYEMSVSVNDNGEVISASAGTSFGFGASASVRVSD